MATHDVTIVSMPRFLVSRNDICFEIRENGEKLGELKVSQGNLHWVPGIRRQQYGYSLDWADFAKLAVKNGKRQRYSP